MARFRFIPKEEKFYADFMAMADLLPEAAKLLSELVSTTPPDFSKADAIRELENKADFWTHDIFQRLHQTFVTPIDREDIHALAGALDDVMDAIDESANLFPLYRLTRTYPGVADIAAIIESQTAEIRAAVGALEKRKGVLDRCREINRLEHEADLVHQSAMGRLFDEEKDPISVIKWKEVLKCLEGTTDRCEDVANLLETIVVKHG